MLTFKLFAVTWAGSFVGALAAGGAGFAFALAASAIWLHALDPLHTTAFVVASGVILHTAFVWGLRKTIEAHRLFPFILGAVIGIPLGVAILSGTDGHVLKECLGLFLLVYGLYALISPRVPSTQWGGRTVDGLVGFIGGILGGIGGFSGVLPTVWTQVRGWPKDTARSVFQPYILVAQLLTLLLIGSVAFDADHAFIFATTVPFLLVGGWIGWRIYGRLDERRFKQIIAALMAISGAALVI